MTAPGCSLPPLGPHGLPGCHHVFPGRACCFLGASKITRAFFSDSSGMPVCMLARAKGSCPYRPPLRHARAHSPTVRPTLMRFQVSSKPSGALAPTPARGPSDRAGPPPAVVRWAEQQPLDQPGLAATLLGHEAHSEAVILTHPSNEPANTLGRQKLFIRRKG